MKSTPTKNNNQRSSQQRNTPDQLAPTEDPVPKSAEHRKGQQTQRKYKRHKKSNGTRRKSALKGHKNK